MIERIIMKVFLAKNKFQHGRNEHDYLIVAKTKKEAIERFNELKEYSFKTYLLKDFKEVETKDFGVFGLEIYPRKDQSITDSLEFSLSIYFNEYIEYNTYFIVETSTTYRALIKIFKDQNKEILADILK